jgi:hypothetical protein
MNLPKFLLIIPQHRTTPQSFARSIALHDTTLAVGISNLQEGIKINRESVFLFSKLTGGLFTQLQNLFVGEKDCTFDMYDQVNKRCED